MFGDDHLPARSTCRRVMGYVADPVRAGHAAGGHRHLHHLDQLRPADHPHRPLQDLPDHRRGGADRGHVAAVSASAWTRPYWQLAIYELPVRRRPRLHDADDRHRRPERGRLCATWARPPARRPSSARWVARSARRSSARCCPAASPTTSPSSWPRPASAPVPASRRSRPTTSRPSSTSPSRSGASSSAAFTSALDDVFLVGVPFLVIAFLIALALKEVPLRTGQTPSPPQP